MASLSTTGEFQMPKVTAKLTAEQAREMFPWIVGQAHIVSAERFGDHAAIVNMGRGAHAVIVNGRWEGCSPTRKYALANVARHLELVAKHLSGSVRC
jgi:hypothetical protein